VNFDLDTQDWLLKPQVARDSFSSVVSQQSPSTSSFIAIAHDIHEMTVHGYVQYMIDEARKYGYELTTVGECLGDHPNNWYRDGTTGLEYRGPAPVRAVSSSVQNIATASIPTSPSTTGQNSAPLQSPKPAGESTKTSVKSGVSAAPAATSTPNDATKQRPYLKIYVFILAMLFMV
jgi:hypothetical protein